VYKLERYELDIILGNYKINYKTNLKTRYFIALIASIAIQYKLLHLSESNYQLAAVYVEIFNFCFSFNSELFLNFDSSIITLSKNNTLHNIYIHMIRIAWKLHKAASKNYIHACRIHSLESLHAVCWLANHGNLISAQCQLQLHKRLDWFSFVFFIYIYICDV